jgi:hypothetical protein
MVDQVQNPATQRRSWLEASLSKKVQKTPSHPIKKLSVVIAPVIPTMVESLNRRIVVQASLGSEQETLFKK